jgi:hypothetical protein
MKQPPAGPGVDPCSTVNTKMMASRCLTRFEKQPEV